MSEIRGRDSTKPHQNKYLSIPHHHPPHFSYGEAVAALEQQQFILGNHGSSKNSQPERTPYSSVGLLVPWLTDWLVALEPRYNRDNTRWQRCYWRIASSYNNYAIK